MAQHGAVQAPGERRRQGGQKSLLLKYPSRFRLGEASELLSLSGP